VKESLHVSLFVTSELGSENTEQISAPFCCDMRQKGLLFGESHFVFYLSNKLITLVAHDLSSPTQRTKIISATPLTNITYYLPCI
jgi:hypothetical protein